MKERIRAVFRGPHHQTPYMTDEPTGEPQLTFIAAQEAISVAPSPR